MLCECHLVFKEVCDPCTSPSSWLRGTDVLQGPHVVDEVRGGSERARNLPRVKQPIRSNSEQSRAPGPQISSHLHNMGQLQPSRILLPSHAGKGSRHHALCSSRVLETTATTRGSPRAPLCCLPALPGAAVSVGRGLGGGRSPGLGRWGWWGAAFPTAVGSSSDGNFTYIVEPRGDGAGPSKMPR